MCDFKPGDEVVCVDKHDDDYLTVGHIYTVLEVVSPDDLNPCSCCGNEGAGLELVETGITRESHCARPFRKVIRRNDSLSIEAFLTIKPGFEEPRKAPAKKREKA